MHSCASKWTTDDYVYVAPGTSDNITIGGNCKISIDIHHATCKLNVRVDHEFICNYFNFNLHMLIYIYIDESIAKLKIGTRLTFVVYVRVYAG